MKLHKIFKVVFSINNIYDINLKSSVLSKKRKKFNIFVYNCNIFPVIDPNEHINNIL